MVVGRPSPIRRFDQLPSLKLTASASPVQMKFPIGSFSAYFLVEIFLPRFAWAHLRFFFGENKGRIEEKCLVVSTQLKTLVKLAHFPK